MSESHPVICTIEPEEVVALMDLVDAGKMEELKLKKQELGTKYNFQWDKVTISALGEVRAMTDTA